MLRLNTGETKGHRIHVAPLLHAEALGMAVNHHCLGPHSQAASFLKLDGRGIIARQMKVIRSDLVEALGGDGALSPQQDILIEGLALRVIRCRMLTAAMLGGDGLSAEAERRLNWHLASIRRDLVALGLERRAAREPTLQEYLSSKQEPAAA